LILLWKQSDFDSPMRRFESSRPSQAVLRSGGLPKEGEIRPECRRLFMRWISSPSYQCCCFCAGRQDYNIFGGDFLFDEALRFRHRARIDLIRSNLKPVRNRGTVGSSLAHADPSKRPAPSIQRTTFMQVPNTGVTYLVP